MARQLRIQFPDAFYHVTCRGNDRREIFRGEDDRRAFLEQLRRSLEIFNVVLLGYACMANHFHLLLNTPEGNLSEFMRHFNISYTAAFNRKYKRSGHLYQGRYKAFLIDADNYLLEVSRYIHLNPVRMKSEKELEERWALLQKSDQTSLPGYLSEKNKKDFVNYRIVLDHMGGCNSKGRRKYQSFVKEGIKQSLESPLKAGEGRGIVGDLDFVLAIRKMLDLKRESLREQPAARSLSKEMSPNELISEFSKMLSMNRTDLVSRGRQSVERAMLMELLYRKCRITQSEIGKLLGGIDYSAVSQSRKRLHIRMEKDSALRKNYQKIFEQLELSRSKI